MIMRVALSKCAQVLSRTLFDHVDCHVKYVCGTNGQFFKKNYHEYFGRCFSGEIFDRVGSVIRVVETLFVR